ncbi:MAG TPA: ATP-binding protein [Vicinamibacterales bacterium]|nr:ATP-binding protein [Vicinamibacterales bacterium]
MQILRERPLRRQVAVVTFCLLVPLVLAAAWSATVMRHEREAEVREQAASIAATAGAYLNQYLTGIDSMASALVRHQSVVALDGAACDRLFAEVLRAQPLVLNIVLSDLQGAVRGTALALRRGADAAVGMPEMREQIAATGKPLVSELTSGVVTGKPTIILAYPVRAANDVIVGVLGIGINLTELQTLFLDIPLPENSVVTMTDARGRVLARSREPERYVGKPAGVDTPAAPPSDVPRTQTLTGLDGVRRFYGNAVVKRGPWLLSVGIPTSVALARAAPSYQREMTIGAVSLIAILLFALGGASMVGSGINRVRDAVRRIADGDLSSPVRRSVPNRELAELQDAFITMAANLREAHQALDRQIEQERKMRETLQSLQRQVVRQERLAAVGILVSGVAHELNNPLQAILGTAELLERRRELSPEALEEVAFVKTQSGRAREIIRNLSRFSAQQPGPPSLVRLADVINEVVQLGRRDLDNCAIALEVNLATRREVYANFTELEQVTLNFVINAQQSIESTGRTGGRILIRAFDAGRKVRLEVQDDGPGVSPEDEAKLFQPFFTTKPVGKGTGLGLSVSYGIIESYGGIIGHQPNAWGGATFFFELPVTESAAHPSPAPAAAVSTSDDRPPVLRRPVSSGI